MSVIPVQDAGGQRRVGARFSKAEFLFTALPRIRIDRNDQAVHSTGAFLLENHSSGRECVVNYGGLPWMRGQRLS